MHMCNSTVRHYRAKQFFVSLAVLFSFCATSFGQEQATAARRYPAYAFTDTVRLKNVPQEEMYNRAWNWFEAQAKTDSRFIEEANPRHGRFIGTTGIPFQSKYPGGSDFVRGKIYFIVRVHVHDDYYVYEFTNFVHEGRMTFNTLTTAPRYPYRHLAGRDWHDMVWEEMKETVKDHVYPLIGSLRANMQKESAEFEHILSRRNAEIPLEDLQNLDLEKTVPATRNTSGSTQASRPATKKIPAKKKK